MTPARIIASSFFVGMAAKWRSPKSEIRNPKENRRPKSEGAAESFGRPMGSQSISKTRAVPWEDRTPNSGLGFRTSFGSRISDFGFLSCRLLKLRPEAPCYSLQTLRSRIFAHVALFFCLALHSSHAAEIAVQTSGSNVSLKVIGDPDNDWRLQGSSNAVQWSTLTNAGTLIGGRDTNAPWRNVGVLTNATQFYRAEKTRGLFDPSLLRTVSIIFTQSNWQTLLTSGRSFDTNTPCTVFLDNGATNFGVGARYKGNTSFTIGGTKKSINLEFDWLDTNADLMTYQTVNLNNAAADETIMREALYFNVMSQYTPCPQGAMCRVHINGGLWGVYSLVQQENTQLIKEWFPSAGGDRWRAPNSPGGGAGFTSSNSAFAYFGTNISSYFSKYALKTDNAATNVAWTRLVNAITTLNSTPTETLRNTLEETWAVDSWLWFLAIENIFADDDSYWNKGADYTFYFEPESGRMHPIEHDGNEAFVVVDVSLSPVVGASATGGAATLNNRPLLYRLLPINEWRQHYLAHMHTAQQ